MAGQPGRSGGRRGGGGRRARSVQARWLGGDAGHRGAPLRPAPSAASSTLDLTPPAGLTAAEVVVWKEAAPHAARLGTLGPETVSAMSDLCRAVVTALQLHVTIERDGWTYVKVSVDGAGVEHEELRKHPLATEWRAWVQRVETMRARFRLTPDGKPTAAPAPVDEWAEFDAPLRRIK